MLQKKLEGISAADASVVLILLSVFSQSSFV